MKTQKIKKVSVIIVALLMIAGSSLFAQKGRNFDGQVQTRGERVDQTRNRQIPDLTEDQETKIKALRVDRMKEMTTCKNQINELKAKKQTLLSSDNSELKEINGVIDQMTDVQNKMMKASAKHHQDVRNILTDEQKVIFDSKQMHGRGHERMARRGGKSRRVRGHMHGKN